MAKAEQLAQKWLKNNPNCQKLFNINGGGFDPQKVLSSLLSSGSYTGFTLNQITLSSGSFLLPSSSIGGFTNPTIYSGPGGVGVGADIFLNTNINTSIDEEAETILEELGHAYNYTTLSGGSSIVYDNPFFSGTYTDPITGQKVSSSTYNFDLIMKNCNK